MRTPRGIRPLTRTTTVVLLCGALGLSGAMLAPIAGAASTNEVTRVGTLQRVPIEPGDLRASDSAVVSIDGIHVAAPDELADGIAAGATVKVTVEVGGSLLSALEAPRSTNDSGALRQLATSVEAGTAKVVGLTAIQPLAEPSVLGTHKLIVVPVYPASEAVPASVSSGLTSLVTATDAYYNTSTYGKIRVTLQKQYAWNAVDMLGCNTSAAEAAATAIAGAVPTDGFTHVVAYLGGGSAACPFAGRAYMPGTFMWLANNLEARVLAHELGHNLGLYHADGLYCSNGAAPWSDSCSLSAYQDPWSAMGNGFIGLGQFDAHHLAQLGVLAGSDVRTTTASETVRLAPLANATGTRGIAMPFGRRTFFLEYRQATGVDSWINEPGKPGDGVIVRLLDWDLNLPGEAGYLDFRAGSSITQAALHAGEGWSAPDGSWGLTVTAADATGATVQITRRVDSVGPSPFALETPVDGTEVYSTGEYAAFSDPTDADSGVNYVDVLLDGVVIDHQVADPQTPWWNLSPLGTLTPGAHTVQARAVDWAGNSTWTPLVRVTVWTPPVYDTPTFSSRAFPRLRSGTVSTTSIPVSVAWGVSADSGICYQEAGSTTQSRRDVAAGARTLDSYQKPGTPTVWTVDAWSCEGYGARSQSVSAKASLNTLNTRPSAFTGTWTVSKGTTFLGGSELLTTQKNAAANFTITARAVELVATRDTTRGKAAVYVDGKLVRTLDLRTSGSIRRTVVWGYSWSAPGKHTIKVVNLGTSGRPKIGLDGLVFLA